MTLEQKYEKCLQDSENFIDGEKEHASRSYRYGKQLAHFFNDELNYADINIHYGYPMEKKLVGTDDKWNLKINFQLRYSEIKRYSPLNAPQVFKYLSTLADSSWSKGEPLDSEAKEIMRGMKERLNPIQQELKICTIGVEWAVHVPDCTTFYINFYYAYDNPEEME
ncbi:MAG: hypothetical protein J1D88_06095 [Treponema sp.]|nr:hypothetical protein [Treponema sp.]